MRGLFRKTDPVCGMKQEKGKGILYDGTWFCSESCKQEYQQAQAHKKTKHNHGCCSH